MPKRIVFLIAALLAVASLTAEVFTPRYTLPGFTPLRNNQLDFYKFRSGFSLSPYAKHKLGTTQMTTQK